MERCLDKESDDRYASTRDLARELATVRDHLTEASGPLSVAPVSRRVRVAGLLALAVVLAGFVGAFLLARQVGDRPLPSFRQLTFRSGEVNHARFAPDGQTIVYSATWGADPLSIFSTRAGSVESRTLGAPGADLLSISVSGEMLVLRDGTLARVSLTGGGERQILEGVVDASWAPNGTDMAVVRQRGTIGSHAQLGASGARLEFPVGKVLYETWGGMEAPRVSAGGDQVAFVDHPMRGDSRGSLAIVDLRGKKRRLSGEFNAIEAAVWSPRGDEIWFSGMSANASMAIYAVSLSGRQRVVARGPGGLGLQDVSSDGRVLLTHGNGRILMMTLAPGQTTERDLSWLDGSILGDLSDDGRTLHDKDGPLP